MYVRGGGGVQGAKIFVNDQSRSLGAPLAKCLEILCAAMPYSAAWFFDTPCILIYIFAMESVKICPF